MAFQIKAGDLKPDFQVTLLDETGAAEDLTSATGVTLRYWLLDDAGPVVTKTAVIDDAANGQVSYSWISGDTDVPGTYLCEWVVDYSGEDKTFPAGGFESFEIYKKRT